ncbi:hypothetical protein C368_01543 [Cryptococcus neoformans 125.91]|nr:hypothetical protein C368_01543 [Cryptococcus neoformans var. grubii 125.91]
MPSRKKGRGRVIIVSDYILKAADFLEKKDDEGNVIERARRIICPGSQEDNWWTAQDVVKQGGRMPWSFHRYLLEDGQPKGLESVLQSRLSPKLLFGEDVEPLIEKALTIMLQNGLFVAKIYHDVMQESHSPASTTGQRALIPPRLDVTKQTSTSDGRNLPPDSCKINKTPLNTCDVVEAQGKVSGKARKDSVG